MKFPNHIVLDFQNTITKTNTKDWSNKFVLALYEIELTSSHFTYQILKNNSNNLIYPNKFIFKNFLISKINTSRVKLYNFSNIKILKTKSLENKIQTNLNLIKNSNIFFLKKEKIYTKLKYSRTPAYDIVSGGVAALFAAFLGFLICEKFGFELLDSGDFYFIFMYAVIFLFSIRLLLKFFSTANSWNFFSSKWIINFYKNLLFMFFFKK